MPLSPVHSGFISKQALHRGGLWAEIPLKHLYLEVRKIPSQQRPLSWTAPSGSTGLRRPFSAVEVEEGPSGQSTLSSTGQECWGATEAHGHSLAGSWGTACLCAETEPGYFTWFAINSAPWHDRCHQFTAATLHCGKLYCFSFFSAPNSFSESFGKDLRKKRPAHNIWNAFLSSIL